MQSTSYTWVHNIIYTSVCAHTVHAISIWEDLFSPLIYVRQIIQFIPDCRNVRTERGAHCNIKNIYLYALTRETFKFIAERKNWATKIRGELVIRMISCFPIYINDYRKLGGIVCGRNHALFI